MRIARHRRIWHSLLRNLDFFSMCAVSFQMVAAPAQNLSTFDPWNMCNSLPIHSLLSRTRALWKRLWKWKYYYIANSICIFIKLRLACDAVSQLLQKYLPYVFLFLQKGYWTTTCDGLHTSISKGVISITRIALMAHVRHRNGLEKSGFEDFQQHICERHICVYATDSNALIGTSPHMQRH